jgi:hypothetical protein
LAGYRYFLVATDDYLRYRWVKLLKKKSETFEAVQELYKYAENEAMPLKVAILRTDGGGEFVSVDFEDFLKSKGIKHEKSAPIANFKMEFPNVL